MLKFPDAAGRVRTKRSPYTIQDLRQVVRNEIYTLLDDEFCRNKEQICIKGSQGENARPGSPGSPGKQGPKGEKGARGQPGLKGNTGQPGPAGPSGPDGRRGERGYQGKSGFPGVKGDKGEPGIPGESLSSPVITSRPVSLTINETQNALLHCDVRANPSAKVTWSKVNSSLPTGRYSESSNNKLVIRNVQLMDAGTFVCTARNILGSARILSKIHVQG